MQKNNYQFIDINSNRKINKKINNNLTLIIIDILDKNNNLNFQFNVAKNVELKIFFLSINSNKQKSCNFDIKQDQNSIVNIQAKIFGIRQSFSKININSSIPKNAEKIVLNQDINGFIFNDGATIVATPSMLVDNNKIVANHSVNIGSINPEKLFYIKSRGISKAKATSMLIKSEYEYLNNLNIDEASKAYKQINKKMMEVF